MLSCKYCEILKNCFFIEHLWWLLLIPIRYPYVTWERGNNKIHKIYCIYQFKEKKISIQKEHDISSNNSKKTNSKKPWLFKLYVTKIKYSNSLQIQRIKDEIKTSFNFAVILWIYAS